MNKKWHYLVLAIMVIIPIVLILLPADYFDEGRATCLSVMVLGKECFACGMTRAAMHLIHLEWDMALYFNAASFIIFPLLAFGYAWYFIQLLRKTELLKSEK